MCAGVRRATTWAKRSSASAYGLIEPETSISSTTRRGRLPRRCLREPDRFAAGGEHRAQRPVGVEAAAAAGSQAQRGTARRLGVQCGEQFAQVLAFGRGEFAEVAVPQDLGVTGRDPQRVLAGVLAGAGLHGEFLQRRHPGVPGLLLAGALGTRPATGENQGVKASL